MRSAWRWLQGCWLLRGGGLPGMGAGKEVPSPPLSDGAHLMFLTVIAASVWVKSNWEVVMGGWGMKSEINVSYYENLILLCLG